MELLLTPIVTRLLRSFIKSAAGEAGSDLRVSLSGGSVLLHNLELNLEPVVKNLPIGVQRAFARQLKVVIPWTSLATQPIQVILDTVEVVVALTEKQQDDKDSSTGSPTAAAADGADTSDLLGSTGGWMGSFTSMLLRTLFNISVTVNNVVVKYLAPTSVATLTCQSIHAYTAADNWEANLQSPEDWLKKVLEIKNTSLCLDERTPDGQVDVFQQPLLRTPCLSVEALVPIFAVLEKTDSVAESTALLNVTVDLLEAATNARQVAWLRTFVTDLPACWAKKLGEPAQAAPTPAAPPVPAGTAAPVPPKPTSSGGSLGAFSRAWGYLTDEAAYVEAALTDGVKAQSIASAPRPKIAAAVSLKGGTWACIDAAMPLRTPSRTASHNQPHTAQPQQQQQQQRQEQQHEVDPQQHQAEQALQHQAELSNAFVELTRLTGQQGAAAATSPRAADLGASSPRSSFERELQHLTSPPLSPVAAGSDAHPFSRTRPSPPPFVVLEWSGLHADVNVGSERLESLDICLMACSLRRHVPTHHNTAVPDVPGSPLSPSTPATPPAYDELFGMHPVCSVDSTALMNSDQEPLALRVRWQLVAPASGTADATVSAVGGKNGASVGPLASPQLVSVHVGQILMAYAPGFITHIVDFAGDLTLAKASAAQQLSDSSVSQQAQQQTAMPGQPSSAADERDLSADDHGLSIDASSTTPHSTGNPLNPPAWPTAPAWTPEPAQPPPTGPLSWLQGRLTLGISVLRLQLAALSAPEADAAAAVLSVSRLSCHVGSIKAAVRPGSLSSALYGTLTGPQPRQGLRVSASGMALGVVTRWQPSCKRHEATGADGEARVSQPVELQVLVSTSAAANPAHGNPQSAPAGSNSSSFVDASRVPRQGQPSSPAGVASTSQPAWSGRTSPARAMPEKNSPGEPYTLSTSDFSPARGSTATPAQLAVAVALSRVSITLSGLQLASVAAVASGVSAEAARKCTQALPSRGLPADQRAQLQDSGCHPWVNTVQIQAAGLRALLTPGQPVQGLLRLPDGGASRLYPAASAAVLLDNIMLSVMANSDGDLPPSGLAIRIQQPCISLMPQLRVSMPSIQLHTCQASGLSALPGQAGNSHQSMPSDQPHHPAAVPGVGTVNSPRSAGHVHIETHEPSFTAISDLDIQLKMPPRDESGSADDRPDAQCRNGSSSAAPATGAGSSYSSAATLPSQLLVSIHSIAMPLQAQHIARLMQFARATGTGPALPPMLSYPPASLPTAPSLLHVALTVDSLAGTVSAQSTSLAAAIPTLDRGSRIDGNVTGDQGFAWEMSAVTLAIEQTSAWGENVALDAAGFPLEPPLETKMVSLSLQTLGVSFLYAQSCTRAPGHIWMLRSASGTSRSAPAPSLQPAAVFRCTLNISNKQTGPGSSAGSADVVLEAEALQLRLFGLCVEEAAVIARHVQLVSLPASRPTDAVMRPPAGPSTQLGIRAMVKGLQLELSESRLPMIHASGTATGPAAHASPARLVAQVEDVVLILDDALAGAGSRGWLGDGVAQAQLVDLSLVAAAVSLWGAGLPHAGLPVMFPADLHLSICKTTPPAALALSVDAALLSVQLSLSVIGVITALVGALSASASAAKERVQLPQPSVFRDGTAGIALQQEQAGPSAQARTSESSSSSSVPAHVRILDDLRCGLFSVSAAVASRPGPMEISLGDKGPGFMSWSGSGESWICWRYAHPRALTSLLVAGVPCMLEHAEFEISYFDHDLDDYAVLPCRCQVWAGDGCQDMAAAGHMDGHEGSELVDLLLIPQVHLADEWQLCWDCPADLKHCNAAYLFKRLLVNPTFPDPPSEAAASPAADTGSLSGPDHGHSQRLGARQDVLPVPLTLALQAHTLRVAFLLEQPSSDMPSAGNVSGRLDEVAAAHLQDFQGSLHKWPDAVSVAFLSHLRVSYNDSSALTEETLLDSFRLSCRVDSCKPALSTVPPVARPLHAAHSGPMPTANSSAEGGSQMAEQLPLHLPTGQHLTMPRPRPQQPGLSVGLRVGEGPLVVRLSELSIHEIKRIIQLASAAQRMRQAMRLQHHQASPVPPPVVPQSTSTPQPQPVQSSQRPQQAAGALQSDAGHEQPGSISPAALAPSAAAFVVRNLCPVMIAFGQAGVDECLEVASSGQQPYWWRASPALCPTAQRQLRFCSGKVAALPTDGPASADSTSSSYSFVSMPEPAQDMQHRQYSAAQGSGLVDADLTESAPLLSNAVQRSASGSYTGTSSTNTSSSSRKRAAGGALLWSDPVDIMAAGCYRRRILWPNGLMSTIAISVSKVNNQFLVVLRPGYALQNRTPHALQLCYTGPLPSETARAGAAAKGHSTGVAPLDMELQQSRSELMIELPAHQGCEFGASSGPSQDLFALRSRPATAAQGQPGTMCQLQLWMGGGDGWSVPLPLDESSPQVQPLRAAGLGDGAPLSPTSRRASTLGTIYCGVTVPDGGTGQVAITFWPPFFLHNTLPLAVECCVSRAAPAGNDIDEQAAGVQHNIGGSTDVICSPSVPPHGEIGLVAAKESSERVSLRMVDSNSTHTHTLPLASSGSDPALLTGPPPLAGAWSEPLAVVAPPRSSAFRFGAAIDGQASLPVVGKGRLVQLLPVGQGPPVSCMLVATMYAAGLPTVRLSLLPVAVLHNCTPFAVTLTVPGGHDIVAQPDSSIPLDWQPLRAQPRKASLLVDWGADQGPLTPPAQGLTRAGDSVRSDHVTKSADETDMGQSCLLRSQPFAIDATSNTQLLLRLPLAQRSTAGGQAAASAHRVVGYLAACVELKAYTRAVALPSQAGLAASSPGSSSSASSQATPLHESVHITITPGCFISNLTRWGADVALVGTACAAGPGGAAHNRHSRCSPQHSVLHFPSGATAPVVNLWQSRNLGRNGSFPGLDVGASRLRRSSSGGDGKHNSLDAQGAIVMLAGQPEQADSAWRQLPPHDGSDVPDMATSATALASQPAPADSPASSGLASSPPADDQQASTLIDIFNPTGRQRLYLAAPDGATTMITYRVLFSRGHLHLVLFHDHQPPCIVRNATARPLLVGYFPPVVNKLGEVQYEAPAVAVRVEPEAELECDLQPPERPCGGEAGRPVGSGQEGGAEDVTWDVREDEEAFLETITNPPPDEPPAAMIKFCAPGSHDWSQPCALTPGTCTAGGCTISISRSCASWRICIQPDQPKTSTQPSPAQQALEAIRPLALSIHCASLQLSVWDDERRRFLGPAPPSTAALIAGSPAARELFCVTLDSLCMDVARYCHLGAADVAGVAWHAPPAVLAAGKGAAAERQPEARAQGGLEALDSSRVVMLLRVAAEALQWDSFLDSSSYPVVCTTLASSSAAAAVSGARGKQVAALILHAEVHHGVATFPLPPMSFRNTWLACLTLHLPTLAVAIDDALVMFVERAKLILDRGQPAAAASGSHRHAQHEGGATLSTPATTGAGRQMHRSSSAILRDDAGRGALPSPLQGPQKLDAAGLAAVKLDAAALLDSELFSEATAASASRLLVENLHIGRIHVLFDIHVSDGSAHIPIALDTHRSPLYLPTVVGQGLLFRPSVLLHGLLAHYMAEALLNAPQMLGSLELLFNPTGLIQSVTQGFQDLVALPLAAIEARSPSQFITGVGLGSASLLRHLSGWTLTSISGFSSAFSRVLERTLVSRSAVRGGLPPSHANPQALSAGLASGLYGLYGGVTAGVTGIVRAPMDGYSDGSGVLLGLGRGLLGAVGLPLSGALDLVSAVSSGLASSTGVSHRTHPRRPGRVTADGEVRSSRARFLKHLQPLDAPDALDQLVASRRQYVAHCEAASLTVFRGVSGPQSRGYAESYAIRRPCLLLTHDALIVLSDGGLFAAVELPLQGAKIHEEFGAHRLSVYSAVASCIGRAELVPQGVQLHIRLGLPEWLHLLPQLRHRAQAAPEKSTS